MEDLKTQIEKWEGKFVKLKDEEISDIASVGNFDVCACPLDQKGSDEMNFHNIPSLSQQIFDLDEEGYTILPYDMQYQEAYIFTFEGFSFSISANDITFMSFASIANAAAKEFIKQFKDTHAITEPMLTYCPPIARNDKSKITIEMRVMDLEAYKEIKKITNG